MIVTSFFPGRIRLRSSVFKDKEIYEKAYKIINLHAENSVTKIERNVITGSVLVEYEPSKIPLAKLEKLKDFFFQLNDEAERFNSTEASRQKILTLLKMIEEKAAC